MSRGTPDEEIRTRCQHFVEVLGLNPVARELSTERLTLATYLIGGARKNSVAFIEAIWPHGVPALERLAAAKLEATKPPEPAKKPLPIRRAKKTA
jgi:hypothetical protein